jgi:hypothetical protein
VLQGLLLVFFVAAMIILIQSVIEESISGVVILIFGVPIAGAFLLLALIAQLLKPRDMG